MDLQGNHIPKDTLRAIGCQQSWLWLYIIIIIIISISGSIIRSSLSLLLVVHQFARTIIVLHQTNIMRLVRTIAWEYRMIIDYDHHWYCDIAENQLLENVERSQLEMLSSHVAQRVRAFHHLRPIVIDPSIFSLFVFFYQPPQIICIVLISLSLFPPPQTNCEQLSHSFHHLDFSQFRFSLFVFSSPKTLV